MANLGGLPVPLLCLVAVVRPLEDAVRILPFIEPEQWDRGRVLWVLVLALSATVVSWALDGRLRRSFRASPASP